MKPEKIRQLLEAVASGDSTPAQAMKALASLPFSDMGFARVDHHRELRTGFPEVIFCSGKTCQQVLDISAEMIRSGSSVLCTRLNSEQQVALRDQHENCQINEAARTAVIGPPLDAHGGRVAIVSAGTSDMPVAEEARVTAEMGGAEVLTVYDAGVAGLHRLLADRDELAECDSLVVVAGMEGALASVIGGLVSAPIIACPTSVGYGASFGGVAALLAMLNSCAPGVSVVNIDNGFGAGFSANLIARVAGAARKSNSG
jgi:pyridinium-3,5-biscarboxylic acid mononucleotide synthase